MRVRVYMCVCMCVYVGVCLCVGVRCAESLFQCALTKDVVHVRKIKHASTCERSNIVRFLRPQPRTIQQGCYFL
jgi:hypothetical protein